MQAKNVLLTVASAVALSFAAVTTHAQIKKGAVLAGGALSLDFGTDKNHYTDINGVLLPTKTSYTDLAFSPKVGYFLTDALVLGLNLSINRYASKDKHNESRTTNFSYTFGTFGRYYFRQKLFLEGEIGLGMQSQSHSNAYFGDDLKSRSEILVYSLGVGYAAFLNDHVALEPMVRYHGTHFNGQTKYAAFQLSLGLQVYF